jgi:hypothetical protein
MKLLPCISRQTGNPRDERSKSGLSLVELLVTVALFSLLGLTLIYTQIFGLRFDQLVCRKLGASDRSRIGFDKLTTDIRAAKIWAIGNGDLSSFTPCGNATNQVGNAIQLSSTTATNIYVRYYFNTNLAKLYRVESGSTTPFMVCDNLTNTTGLSMSFWAEDYAGRRAQDLTFKYVIATRLEFCQYQYPLTRVGPNYYYNYYRMEFRVASHNYD